MEELVRESRVAEAIRAADGWPLTIWRFTGPSVLPVREPVLMTPGFLENANFFDLDPERSMARALMRAGFEVWVLEPRGVGASRPKNPWSSDAWRFSIDDFISKDCPAAVDHVLQRTGKDQILWVGHSMGGLMIYGYLETQDASKVKAAVSIAGGGAFGPDGVVRTPRTLLYKGLSFAIDPALARDQAFPVGGFLRWLKRRVPQAYKQGLRFVGHRWVSFSWSGENLPPELADVVLERAVSSTSTSVCRQFIRAVRTGECRTTNGIHNYMRELKRVKTPFLVIGGGNDQVIPWQNCRWVYEQLGSKDKQMIVFSRKNGDPVDFGHLDLVVGLHAPRTVYPAIASWLSARASCC